MPCEQLGGGLLAAELGEVAVGDGVVGQARVAERGPPAFEPVDAGGHVDRPGDGPDPPAAAVDQPLGHEPCARDVVGVDVGDLVGGGPRPADERARQAQGREVLGEPVAGVVRDDDRAVDVAAAEVAQHPPLLLARAGEQQHQLEVARREHPVDRPQRVHEEGVGEHPLVRLGHHERDRVGAPGDQAAGRRVGGVAQLLDRRVDRRQGPGGDPVAAVDRPRRGRPGHAGEARDLVEGRRVAGSTAGSRSAAGSPWARYRSVRPPASTDVAATWA